MKDGVGIVFGEDVASPARQDKGPIARVDFR